MVYYIAFDNFDESSGHSVREQGSAKFLMETKRLSAVGKATDRISNVTDKNG